PACERIIRRDLEQPAVLVAGLLVAPQAIERRGPVQPHLRQAGIEGARAIETGDGLIVAMEVLQRGASQELRIRRTRVERNRARHDTLGVLAVPAVDRESTT